MNILMEDMHSNLKGDLVGKLNDILFNIKCNEVRVIRVYSTNHGQQGLVLLSTDLQNLQGRHGIRGLGKVFNNIVALRSPGRRIVCCLADDTLGGRQTVST